MKKAEYLLSKVLSRDKLSNTIHVQKFMNKKIVFTNGCFDILHRGHIEYLAQASDLGDFLIIGLNSDLSVKKLKGENRPINDENDRAFLLAALDIVDAVVIFGEDTPEELIKEVRPDVLVKGGDWKPEQIVGADFVKSIGGEVRSIDFIEGYSTSKTIFSIQGDQK